MTNQTTNNQVNDNETTITTDFSATEREADLNDLEPQGEVIGGYVVTLSDSLVTSVRQR